MGEVYQIRHYEPSDREGYQSLYEEVFDYYIPDEKLDWKFVHNPYADHTPIIVAETDGQIVGSRAFVGHQIRAGDQTVRAFQGTDAMVHPDHRQRGVYSRLVKYTTEYYENEEQALRFTFPNKQARTGNLKHGARLVGSVPTFFRIQNPAAMLSSSTDAHVSRLAEQFGTPIMNGYFTVRDRLASTPAEAVTIDRHTDIPADALGSLYEKQTPDGLHTVRDESYYRWRFNNPSWEYVAYTARREDTLVGSMVVGTTTRNGAIVTRLADVLPIGERTHNPVLAYLLETALAEYRDSDVIAAFGRGVSRSLLTSYGFFPDDRLPLSRFTADTEMVIRPFSSADSRWWLDDKELTNEANWLLEYSDHDTS